MKVATLECIDPLLAVLRGYSVLQEVRPAVFHLDGSGTRRQRQHD